MTRNDSKTLGAGRLWTAAPLALAVLAAGCGLHGVDIPDLQGPSELITARPVGTDANGAVYRSVRLELRSAEPRLFPQVPTCGTLGAPPPPLCNVPPHCAFVVELGSGRVGSTILFQSTDFDPDGTIVRYEWFFGDGTPVDYHPDTVHIFRFAGSYVVTHKVTDDDGAQDACSATVTFF